MLRSIVLVTFTVQILAVTDANITSTSNSTAARPISHTRFSTNNVIVVSFFGAVVGLVLLLVAVVLMYGCYCTEEKKSNPEKEKFVTDTADHEIET